MTTLSIAVPLVLIVDDQEANVRLMGSVLSDAGFDVMPAFSGEQALRRIEKQTPDLVLLDMRMPQMDGFAVLETLKTDPHTADIPVIFVTAAHEREFIVRALEAGAADYVTKPFVADELIARARGHADLKLTRDRLRRALKDREAIASIVAHDLKNPLFNITLSAELLQDSAAEPEKVRKIATSIASSARKTTQFIEHFLQRRADVELREGFAPVASDVKKLIEVCLGEFEQTLRHKHQRVTLSDHLKADVLVDIESFGVVFRNLLSNASKYSDDGAEIELIVERGRPGFGRVVVADRGPGVSEAQKDRLFRQFVRLDAVPTGGESSTGVGLAAALREVRWMGGELWHEARPGGGSLFLFELALAPRSQSELNQ